MRKGTLGGGICLYMVRNTQKNFHVEKTNKQDARDLNAESFVKWWLILIDEAVADRVRVSVKDICGLFAGYAVVATGER